MLSRPTKEVRTRGTADFCRRNAMVGETKGPLHLASQQWVLRKGLSATRWACGDFPGTGAILHVS